MNTEKKRKKREEWRVVIGRKKKVLEGGSRAGKSFCTLELSQRKSPLLAAFALFPFRRAKSRGLFTFFFQNGLNWCGQKPPGKIPHSSCKSFLGIGRELRWARVTGWIRYNNTAKQGLFHTALQATEITSHFTLAQLAGSSGAWLSLGAVPR